MDPIVTLDGVTLHPPNPDGTGFMIDAAGMDAWYGTPKLRTSYTAAPNAAGSYTPPQSYEDVRALPITGTVSANDTTGLLSSLRVLAGMCVDPARLYTLQVVDELGTLTMQVQRSGDTLASPVGPNSGTWSLSLTAPDPNKYGPAVSLSTALPSSSGGLDWGAQLAPNPSFEVDTSGWSGLHSATVTRQAGGTDGSFSALVTSTQATTASAIITAANVGPVTAGAVYQFSASVNPSGTSTVTFNVDWYNGSGAYLSTTAVSFPSVPTGWVRKSSPHTAPATAATGSLYIDGGVMAVNATLALDMIQFVGPGLDWSTGGGLNWGTVSSTGLVQLTNTGTASSWPVFTISGPTDGTALTNPSVANTATGQRLAYTGSLHQGDQLVIDTNPLHRSVLLNGVSYRRFLTTAQFFSVPPASTVAVQFSGTATSATPQLTASLSAAY